MAFNFVGLSGLYLDCLTSIIHFDLYKDYHIRCLVYTVAKINYFLSVAEKPHFPHLLVAASPVLYNSKLQKLANNKINTKNHSGRYKNERGKT